MDSINISQPCSTYQRVEADIEKERTHLVPFYRLPNVSCLLYCNWVSAIKVHFNSHSPTIDVRVHFYNALLSLNTERTCEKEGHASFEHLVGFLTDHFKWRMPS